MSSDELFSTSDVLSIHTKLSDRTRGYRPFKNSKDEEKQIINTSKDHYKRKGFNKFY